MAPHLTLVGDGIENPLNARTLLDAAKLFGTACHFRDRKGLGPQWDAGGGANGGLPTIDLDALRGYRPLIALDNLERAEPIYGYRLPPGSEPAVVVGNERHGIARDVQVLADRALEIPLAGRQLNCLNVAAAAAVALYYLARGGGGGMQVHAQPERRRPEVLLLGAVDQFELGSTIRSAGAFGWRSLLIEDRANVWFGGDHATRTEGRAAARRARNPIRLLRAQPAQRYGFDEAVIVTRTGPGLPLLRSHLARGARQVLVFLDERTPDYDTEDWSRLARRVTFVTLESVNVDAPYHFHLVASIALAEAARQIGRAERAPRGPAAPRLRYRSTIAALPTLEAQTVDLEDLAAY